MSVICHCDSPSYLICQTIVLHARFSKQRSQSLNVSNLYSSMEEII
jgi:hypothetical protein